MAIEQLDKLDAAAFLEKVRETPYSWEETFLDNVSIITSLFANALDYFLRPFFTLRKSYSYCMNYVPIKEFKIKVVLTSQNIEKFLVNPNNSEVIKAKLIHIVETTERLSKKMGLGKVVVTLSTGTNTGAYSTFALNLIILSWQKMPSLDHKQLEWVIAHELAHLQHHDVLKRLILASMVLACNLVAFRYFTWGRAIGIGILTQIIAGPVERRIYIYQERAADAKALVCLNSNEGMINFCYLHLKKNYTLKQTPTEELRKKFPNLTIEKIKNIQSSITPNGNNREDFIHPSLTERLAHALSFNPSSRKMG